MLISIPCRQAQNKNLPKYPFSAYSQFPFLVGRLKTWGVNSDGDVVYSFPFLVGRLKTERRLILGFRNTYISIPCRQAQNEEALEALENALNISIPCRQAQNKPAKIGFGPPKKFPFLVGRLKTKSSHQGILLSSDFHSLQVGSKRRSCILLSRCPTFNFHSLQVGSKPFLGQGEFNTAK